MFGIGWPPNLRSYGVMRSNGRDLEHPPVGVPALVLVLALSACTGERLGHPTTDSAAAGASTVATVPHPTEPDSFAGDTPAPEFPDGLDWLNTERPLTLAELRGKAVLLDFWTYGCINCQHIIPDLKASRGGVR